MARFVQQKDLAFFEKISKELVDVVVQTTVEIFKLSISESRTNLYGESLGKSYLPSVQCACMIERDESVIDYEGFGFFYANQINKIIVKRQKVCKILKCISIK